jgi:antitoxin (DNA-binding transcriptional repressor) of toxin-antitoxin stability system
MSIVGTMSSHSVAEAKERFPEHVRLALRGEPVVITRAGRPVSAWRTVPPASVKAVAPDCIAWLRAHRIQPARPRSIGGITLIRQMRDED